MLPIVEFILEGKLFATRTWSAVPRVGEVVLLKMGGAEAEVTQVVWGDYLAAPSGRVVEGQWVQVLCKTVDIPVKETEMKPLVCPPPLGISRDAWHDKAWELYHAKTFEDTQLAGVNAHTMRAVFDATFDALFVAPTDSEV